MHRLKSEVTKFFSRRKLLHRSLADKEITHADDLFELYVLHRLIVHVGSSQARNTQATAKGTVFLVACAPSENWQNASYFEVTDASGVRYGIRTGFSIYTNLSSSYTAELDVVVVKLAPNQQQRVEAGQAVAGVECKWRNGKFTQPTAEAVLGKAHRIWGLPVSQLGTNTPVSRFSVASKSAADPSALHILRSENIAFLLCDGVANDLEPHLLALAALIRPVPQPPKLPKSKP